MDGMQSETEFVRVVEAVLRRYGAQNGQAVEPAQLEAMAARLAALVRERGLPRPLADDERGEAGGAGGVGAAGGAGGLPEEVCAALAARVAGVGAGPMLAEAAKQLVKACFYPELGTCRNSYREVGRDGACRRQELARARGRVSGSHCVDCPHWVALTPGAHRGLLQGAWCDGAAAFEENRGVFLPEDFRTLRHWLHAAARGGAQ